tara:strand:- start:359 stop:1039 length:681 start_codon:yes stop_codon:yes gene_type:complete
MNDAITLNSAKIEQKKTAEELELEFNKTFIALKKNLLDISNKTDLLDAICDLDYINNIHFDDDEDDPIKLININNIDGDLHYKKDNFKCLCGKTHLKNLNIFSLKNKEQNIIIGSTCIDRIHNLTSIHSKNIALINKITEILELIDIDITKKENNPCLKCGDLAIKKKTDYKNPHRNHLCKTCIISNNYIYCKDCPKKINIEYLRGTIKIRCKSCWFKNRKLNQFH